jgi:hypothetical protein
MNTKTAKRRSGRAFARAAPISDGELARLRELHGTGASCRQIAGEMNRAPTTVSRHAAEMGLFFDRSQVKIATAARVADVAARRAEVSAQFIAIVGKINDAVLAELDETGAEVKPWRLRDFSYAAGAFFDRHLSQADHDAASESGSEVDAWLRDLTGQDPPRSRSDSDESAKSRSVLGALMDDITKRHGSQPTDER